MPESCVGTDGLMTGLVDGQSFTQLSESMRSWVANCVAPRKKTEEKNIIYLK